jgi:uncharacterized protein (DUF302 family)
MTVPDAGIITIESHHTVDETVERATTLLRARGTTLFVVIDHGGDAASAGLEMRAAKLMVFGSAAAGTPLMIASPSIALDLPLKLLVWEDADGEVWMSYNSAAYLQARHNLPHDLVGPISAVAALAAMSA